MRSFLGYERHLKILVQLLRNTSLETEIKTISFQIKEQLIAYVNSYDYRNNKNQNEFWNTLPNSILIAEDIWIYVAERKKYELLLERLSVKRKTKNTC